MMEDIDNTFCKNLPKVELHAHLGGSLCGDTIKKLVSQRPNINDSAITVAIEKGAQRTMHECFDMFSVIHSVVDSAQVITEVTKDVISDFANDGVHYLELRSTPRDVMKTGLTKRLYIESVLQGIKEYHYEHDSSNPIVVRFLPSVDRAQHPNEAAETIKLAQEYMLTSEGIVVGLDFSGNPYKGNASDFVEMLLSAKSSGLKLSVHAAEICGRLEDDKKLLKLPIDRIGHGTFISDDKALFENICQRKIPLELCLTSNIKTKTCPNDFRQHHLSLWRNKQYQHPCVICTDDKGIFATSLSSEYYLAAHVLNYSKEDVSCWARETIDYIFADEATKKDLQRLFKKKCSTLLGDHA